MEDAIVTKSKIIQTNNEQIINHGRDKTNNVCKQRFCVSRIIFGSETDFIVVLPPSTTTKLY